MADELCLCGRFAWKIHCPQCGSATVLGLASRGDIVTRPDGSTVKLRVFRCRRCSTVFNDDDWMLRCQAPPQRLGRPSTVIEKTNTAVADLSQKPPEHLLGILEKLKKEKGY